jgi:hypothetical protein
MEDDEQFADEHEFCCGNPRKRCPKARVRAGGGFALTDESAQKQGLIEFNPDQARELFKWLKNKGFGS